MMQVQWGFAILQLDFQIYLDCLKIDFTAWN
jgi:hypothetical protein